MGMFFFLTQFLRGVLGYSDLQTGFAFVPLTVTVFLTSQLSARVLVERFGDRRVLLAGLTLSMIGMLGLTQLGEGSGYLALLAPLVIFGAGNGLAFVPLTTAALAGVDSGDAGAASGVVHVMQQLGGSLGLAVLVTVFGSTSRDVAAHPGPHETAVALARHAFVAGADSAFWTSTAMVLGALALVAALIRTVTSDRRPTADDANGDVDAELAGEPALAGA
jgi:MFS family permease